MKILNFSFLTLFVVQCANIQDFQVRKDKAKEQAKQSQSKKLK